MKYGYCTWPQTQRMCSSCTVLHLCFAQEVAAVAAHLEGRFSQFDEGLDCEWQLLL